MFHFLKKRHLIKINHITNINKDETKIKGRKKQTKE